MKRIVPWLLLAIPTFGAPVGHVIQIAYQVPMSTSAQGPRDFYIDLGSRHGLGEGDLIQVHREISVMNASSGQPWHLLKVALGEARIIVVSDFVSLARPTRLTETEKLPRMNYRQFMLGDSVSRLQGQN